MKYDFCGKCVFFVEITNNTMVNRIGQCRRFPPVVVMDEEETPKLSYEFPLTTDTSWCGEYFALEEQEQ